MSKSELNRKIVKVAKNTGKTKQEIAAKIMAKDYWTWYLVKTA